MSSRLFILILCVVFIFLSGCKKATEEKIIGEWQLVPMEETTNVIVWTFHAEGIMVRTLNDTTNDAGTYECKNNLFGKYLIISDLDNLKGLPGLSGKHKILKLTNDILILQRVQSDDQSSPFYRSEFIKKQ